jgi:hypothetical protein
MRSQNSPGHLLNRQAKEILDLCACDQNGDAICEPDYDRMRNKLDCHPIRVTPSATSKTPAITVHMNSPIDSVRGNDA